MAAPTRLECKAWLQAAVDARQDDFKTHRRAVLRSEWGRRLVDRAKQPARKGVVVGGVHNVDDLPVHFFNPASQRGNHYMNSVMNFLEKVAPVDALVVRGVFFGHTKNAPVVPALCNFVLFAYNDERAEWCSYLSKRAFSEGCRHNFCDAIRLTNVIARRRWTRRVAPHAVAVGRAACAFKSLFEETLRPGGAACKRARLRFESHAQDSSLSVLR